MKLALRVLCVSVFALASVSARAASSFVTRVADICPGGCDAFWPYARIGSAGAVPFTLAVAPELGFEPWTLDGAAQTATLIENINGSGHAMAGGGSPFAWRDLGFFAADDGFTGVELYVTDGTPEGTESLGDLTPGSAYSLVLDAVPGIDALYFIHQPTRLFRTDGTTGGTSLVDHNVDTIHGLYRSLVMVSHNDGGGHLRLAYTSGAAGEDVTEITTAVEVTNAYIVYRPNSAAYRNQFVFVGQEATSSSGWEPWTTRATAATTSRIADIAAGPGHSSPTDFTYHAGDLYFVAGDPTYGRELWRYDGFAATRETDLRAGNFNGVLQVLGSVGPRLLFIGDDGSSGRELWGRHLDGTVARIADLTPGAGSSFDSDGYDALSFAALGERAYFALKDEAFALEPGFFVTDGTAAGTQSIDARPNFVERPHAAGDRLYFAASFGDEFEAGGIEPWSLDLFAQAGPTACRNPHIPVPDADATGVSDALWIDADLPIAGLDLSVDIEHSYVGDLVLTLTHTDTGKSVTFLDIPTSCSGNDAQITFSDQAAGTAASSCANITPAWPRFSRWLPLSPLAEFAGDGTAGKWVLTAKDNLGAFYGVLHSWCLDFRLASGALLADSFETATFAAWRAAAPSAFE